MLNKVIEWCVHHKSDPPASNDDDADSRKKTTDIEEWDQKFMQVDQEMLFEIILVGQGSAVAQDSSLMQFCKGCQLFRHQGPSGRWL